VRHDLLDDIELQLGRHQVGNPRRIATRVLFPRHEFGFERISDSREDDRNVLGCSNRGLASGRRDSDNDIRILADELAHDLLCCAEITLRALEVDFEVFAFHVAVGGKAGDQPLFDLEELGRVVHGDDGDVLHVRGLRRSGKRETERGPNQEAGYFRHVQGPF
jgi:hypothetical protein